MRRVTLFFLVCSFLFLADAAFAGIPVPPGDYTGSRTTPGTNGVNATGGYTDGANGGFKIAWDISFDGSYWNYAYTFTDKDGSTLHPDASHWIVEISPEIPFDQISDFIFDANGNIQTPSGDYWEADPYFPNTTKAGENNGNPNLGADLIGIKLDTSSSAVGGTYTFRSVEPPIWGDFYVK